MANLLPLQRSMQSAITNAYRDLCHTLASSGLRFDDQQETLRAVRRLRSVSIHYGRVKAQRSLTLIHRVPQDPEPQAVTELAVQVAQELLARAGRIPEPTLRRRFTDSLETLITLGRVLGGTQFVRATDAQWRPSEAFERQLRACVGGQAILAALENPNWYEEAAHSPPNDDEAWR